MTDSLMVRAQTAIEENRRLRERRQELAEQRERERIMLRLLVLECAMMRAEIKAIRDNRRSE
jgi:hypothetical protein